jgi:hypothetical protein
MAASDHIAISFLAVKAQDFTFSIYRKKLENNQESVPGIRHLPLDCLVDSQQTEKKIPICC